jgi:hypothetical protein
MNYLLKTSLALGLISGLAVAGCGKKDAEQAAQKAKNEINTHENPAMVETATFASECVPSANTIAKLVYPGTKYLYDLSSLKFTKKQIFYSDRNCKAGTEGYLIQETGTIDIKGPSTIVTNAFDEDFSFDHTYIYVVNDDAAKLFNLVGICGYSDHEKDAANNKPWVAGSANQKDVSSRAGLENCPGKQSPRPAPVPEIVLKEQNNTVLYFGSNVDGDVSKGRPTTLNREQKFIKQ